MNIFDFPPETLGEELTQILAQRQGVRIERILSDHHTTDWYDQEEAEWVCLLSGRAELEFETGIRKLKKGDSLLILPHERHRVAKTTRCIWLCVFFEDISPQKHFVYLLQCGDNSLYCGYTNDLQARIKTHNRGKGAKYTRSRLPVRLVYAESFGMKSQALKREYELKQLSKEEKLKLIENYEKNSIST